MFYELLMAKAMKNKKKTEYIELEYIGNTSTSYIFFPLVTAGKDIVEIEYEAQFTRTDVQQAEIKNGDPYFFIGLMPNSVWYAGCGYYGNSSVQADTDWHKFRLVSYGEDNGFWLDGTRIYQSTPRDSAYLTQGFRLWIGQGGSRTTYNRKKYVKVKVNGKLVYDLIPVLDKDLVPCMYDKVSGQYFYNQGGGEFEWKLPNQLEYLESTGTQYIDTGFLSKDLADKSLYIRMKTTGDASSYAYNGAYHISGTGLTIQFGLLATSDTLCRTTLNHFDPSYLNVTNLQKSEFTEMMMTPTEYWVNGEFKTTHEQTSVDKILETNNPFLIFGRSQYNQSNSITPMIISEFWIKDKDGKFVQYLISVYDKTLTPCMYDLVSKKYFYNNGTGQFKGYFEDGSQLVSYLTSTGTQYIETGLTVTPTIGFLGEAEASLTDASFETLAGYDTFFLPFAVVPSSKRICMGYGDNTDAPTLYPLIDGRLIPSTQASSTNSSLFIKYSGRFRVGLNFKASNVWQFEDANIKYEVNLPEVLPQDSTHTITVFGRKYDDNITTRFMWRGPIYKAIFTDGKDVIMNLIPVRKSDSTVCMYDLITKQYFINKGTGSFTYGTQVNLFDPTKPSYVAGYISTNNNITSSTLTDTFYIPCKPNTTYLVKRTAYKEANQVWRVATIPTEPTVNMSIPHFTGGLIDDLYLVIKSRDIDKYLLFSEGRTLHTDDLSKFTVLEIEDNNSLIA